jgi:hypothetical protein
MLAILMASWLKAVLAPISIAQAAINLRAFRFCIAGSPELEFVVHTKRSKKELQQHSYGCPCVIRSKF